MIQYQHFNTPHHAMDTLLGAIYKDRVLNLRDAKLIEPSKYDLRKPLSTNERRQINYAINKYDSVISNNKANKIAAITIKNKKTQSLLRRKGYLIKNNRVFIPKTKNQKVNIKRIGNKIQIIKKIGKNKKVVQNLHYGNIFDDLNNLKLKDKEFISLNYFGYGMTEVLSTVEEAIELINRYLQQEGYDDLSSFKKQELLSRYSFETYKF